MSTLANICKMTLLILKAILRIIIETAQHIYILVYLSYLLLLLPLRWFYPKLYWYIEGILFRWLLGIVASWGWSAGYSVIESGEDVTKLQDDEAVVMVNHQSTGDVLTLMTSLQDKGPVLKEVMWLMDKILILAPTFGPVSFFHGDFFIQQGKQYRESQIKLLAEHLQKIYWQRFRKWVILFPEGGFLRKRRAASQKFARKNNLPVLEHVTLPRTGAMTTILQTLRNSTPMQNGPKSAFEAEITSASRKSLKWVIDITIGYPGHPEVKPMNVQSWILGYRQPCCSSVHYRYFPIHEVPEDPDELLKWMYQRFVEKEELLSHFYSTGEFPTPATNCKVTKKPKKVELSAWWFLTINASYIVLMCLLKLLYNTLYQLIV
ncbi:acyl-CoA:lysophosphatidylglycerol acyltransferase 1-like [Glandiceps talaboti]